MANITGKLIIEDSIFNSIASRFRNYFHTDKKYMLSEFPSTIDKMSFYTATRDGSGGLIVNSLYDHGHSFVNESYCIKGLYIGENVKNLRVSDFDRRSYTYRNLIPVTSESLEDMDSMYNAMDFGDLHKDSLIGVPVCGSNVRTMTLTYANSSIVGPAVCGPNVTNMYGTYLGCENLTGAPVCGDKVEDFSSTYFWCMNLSGPPVCGNNVIDARSAYLECISMKGTPVIGDKTEFISEMYYNCSNLTGEPDMKPSVKGDAGRAYYNCTNLIGTPYLSYQIVTAPNMYSYCAGLVGTPRIPDSLQSADGIFAGCSNLKGTVEINNGWLSMKYAFTNCDNLDGFLIYGTPKTKTNANLSHMFSKTPNGYEKQTNIVINNKALYTNLRARNDIFGCSFTSSTAAEINVPCNTYNFNVVTRQAKVIRSVNYLTKSYCYNAARNIYLYCME